VLRRVAGMGFEPMTAAL